MRLETVTIEPLTCDGRTAAKLLGCGFTTLKKLVAKGEIVPVRIDGCDPRYSVEQLRDWVRAKIGGK